MNRPLPLLLVGLLTGCGMRHVPASALARLTEESRGELAEAESSLALRIDEAEEAQAAIAANRGAKRRAQSRLSAAIKEETKASEAEEQAHLSFLELEEQVARARLEVEQRGSDCARLRLEQARVRVAVREKVDGLGSLTAESFEEGARRCEEEVKDRRAQLSTRRGEASTARDEWELRRSENAGVGGAGSAYVQ